MEGAGGPLESTEAEKYGSAERVIRPLKSITFISLTTPDRPILIM
jgi:hypothetical protein